MSLEITVAFVAAAAAIAGGLVSGSFDWLVDLITRPKLVIDMPQGDATQTTATWSEGEASVTGIFGRVRVRNTGFRIAKRCSVYLTDLKKVYPSGRAEPTAFHDSMVLSWPNNDFAPRDIPNGVTFYADVASVRTHVSRWFFAVQQLYASQVGLNEHRGTYRFTVTVTAENAKPRAREIEIFYDGDWKTFSPAQVG
jgi:hypothetical protein